MIRALAGVALLCAAPAVGQRPAPQAQAQAHVGQASALAWLAGNWRGTGTMFGSPSEASLAVSPALGGRFLEFSYRAGRFEGRAFYRPAAGGWQAHWFDNRGVAFPIVAQASATLLTSEWGDGTTERGRTVYRLAEDGRLHITDSVRLSDGGYRDFASHILTRAR